MKIFNKLLLSLLILTFCHLKSQYAEKYTYSQLDEIFDAYEENDERAMVFVSMYIAKAKKEQRSSQLIAGYDEAAYYTGSVDRKIKYADSAVSVALQMRDADLTAMAYLKRGIIYYYNKRDYRKALNEYLTAFKTAKNTDDLYLYNKILYHLGIVRCYLGYYQEAALHFKETASYYEKNISDEEHPNIRSNNEHGYLNSIYRLSTCYRNLKSYRREDSLIIVGIKRVKNTEEFAQEFAYFQKAKGIQSLRKGKSAEAERYLKTAEKILQEEEDFAALAGVDFYLGKLNFTNGKRDKALVYFKKVDSILNKFNFVTPEVVNNYKYLIQYAKQKGDDRLQLYYTNKLLRADSVITSDFAVLSTKMLREYQIDRLNESRDRLVRKHKYGSTFLSLILAGGLLAFYFFVIRSRQKEKLLTIKYEELLEKLRNEDETNTEIVEINLDSVKSTHNDERVKEILKNLKIFEEKKQFLDKELKLPDVARLIKSHRSELSSVLNEHMKMSFTQYLKILRIQYITKQLMDNKVFLQYSMDTLTAECGMKNRNVFSNHFLQINGIRPADFVRKRLEEQENT
ncbi:helix-turn-helix domain-containing protein [Chryseobacterium viscerum]|uniref:AraC family transcriptional regulator n=1 Tax=Chryseobacterium viscerum TaxID=1037377 RepID=A0A316WJ86_9FLAO|nr:helix-turn-helix domain-containing protein [Chryseobacterium viscerum]PWN58450.1 AraC family transcriptional regulator [Chryseobacterium viscerum]